MFPPLNHAVPCGMQPMPLLLENYQAAMDKVIKCGVTNLTTLTAESMHGCCNNVLIPKLSCQWQSDIQQTFFSLKIDKHLEYSNMVAVVTLTWVHIQYLEGRIPCWWPWTWWCCGITENILWNLFAWSWAIMLAMETSPSINMSWRRHISSWLLNLFIDLLMVMALLMQNFMWIIALNSTTKTICYYKVEKLHR